MYNPPFIISSDAINKISEISALIERRNIAFEGEVVYPNLDPFKEKDLLKAHGIMMKALTDDARHYRSGGVGVFGEKGLVHMAPPPQRVPELMGNLFSC